MLLFLPRLFRFMFVRWSATRARSVAHLFTPVVIVRWPRIWPGTWWSRRRPPSLLVTWKTWSFRTVVDWRIIVLQSLVWWWCGVNWPNIWLTKEEEKWQKFVNNFILSKSYSRLFETDYSSTPFLTYPSEVVAFRRPYYFHYWPVHVK